ncbi:MAG: alpha/beta hydrolase [Pseudonocardia sp.]
MRMPDRAGRRHIHDRTNSRTVVLLPGSGSDEVFVTAAFHRPLAALGWRLVAPRPVAGSGVVAGYRVALDAAADACVDPDGDAVPLVGGVSLGAHVAARWAADRAARGLPGPAGLLLAMPAWTGRPDGAPAAVAARSTARALRRDGVAATAADARAGTPRWLGDELTRAWSRHGNGLADSMAAAAAESGPTAADLARLRVPVGIVGLTDDPVHPVEVASAWRALAPCAALITTSLAATGRDPETLGRAAALAWLRAVSAHG